MLLVNLLLVVADDDSIYFLHYEVEIFAALLGGEIPGEELALSFKLTLGPIQININVLFTLLGRYFLLAKLLEVLTKDRHIKLDKIIQEILLF